MSKRSIQIDKVHFGKLYWASLLNTLPKELILPSLHTDEDRYSLGWQFGDIRNLLNISFEEMLYATAEAAVALSVFADTIRMYTSKNKLSISFNESSRCWVEALGLNQAARGEWETLDNKWYSLRGCQAYPVHKIELKNQDDVYTQADELSKVIGLLPDNLFSNEKDDIQQLVKHVSYEAYLNILEHAYRPGKNRYMYTCVTITPPNYHEDYALLQSQFSSHEEIEWLKNNTNSMIVEIALADCGQGIPATLWKDAKQRALSFTAEWDKGKMDERSRAISHQNLCEYSFHHDSTRKTPEDFANIANKLNWRGLHRCLKQTEHLSGSIVLCSGRARAGYTFIGNKMKRLSLSKNITMDFPGTMLVLRFPTLRLPVPQNIKDHESRLTSLRVGYLASDKEVKKGLPIDLITRCFGATDREIEDARLVQTDNNSSGRPKNTLISKDIAESLSFFSKVGKKVMVIYCPFRRFDNEGEITTLLRSLPPNHVCVVLFAQIPQQVRRQLLAYDMADWSSTTHGTPRLLYLWDNEHSSLSMQIAGAFPISLIGQKLYADLEQLGSACLIHDCSAVHELAGDLARTYPDFVVWDKESKTLTLSCFESTICSTDISLIIDKAFYDLMDSEQGKSYLDEAKQDCFLFLCRSGEAIRLPTGRLVSQFLSVLSMLRAFPILASALSQRLSEVLKQIEHSDEIHIMADSTASYFVANRLLRTERSAPKVHIIHYGIKGTLKGKIVVFVDLIYSGDTVNRLVRGLRSIAPLGGTVVACIDTRTLPSPWLNDHNWNVVSLVKFYFNPIELPSEGSYKSIYEVDTITHVPFVRERICEFISMATDNEMKAFLDANPNVFRTGFHHIGGMVHTVSLNTQMLLQNHSKLIIGWFLKEILRLWHDLPISCQNQTIVIFCDPNSNIYSIVDFIASEIAKHIPKKQPRVVISLLTGVAPDSKPVFPRPESSVLSEYREANSQGSLFTSEPIEDFVGIYLGDACFTGKSLQDFLTKCTLLQEPRPKAIFALVLVNRLSPREVRFMNICTQLSFRSATASARNSRPLFFHLTALFRLQVKPVDHGELQSVPDIISQLLQQSPYFDSRLNEYIKRIGDNMRSIFNITVEINSTKTPVLHPFYPFAKTAICSTRAVHLRHLLALSEQNEGVLSQVFENISDSLNENDFSILSVLAIEPQLLHRDPLSVWCWQNIHRLCHECFKQTISPEIRSDAILILSQKPEEFLKDLEAILQYTSDDPILLTQIACFLLLFMHQDNRLQGIAQSSLKAINATNQGNDIQWLCNILNASQRAEVDFIVQDDKDAIARIHLLISETWPHVPGLNMWQEFDDCIKRLTQEKDLLIDQQEIALGYACMEYAERVLLSGLAGIRFIDSRRRPQDSTRIWDSLMNAIRSTGEIHHMLDDLSKHNSISEYPEGLVFQWNRLRRLTLKAASPARILGSTARISQEPSVIEQLLPSIYCAPYSLIRELSIDYVKNMAFAVDLAKFEEGIVIVPVSLSLLADFLRILFENMKLYNADNNCSCKMDLAQSDGTYILNIIFKNKPDSLKQHGEGRGIPLLRQFAKKGKFLFDCEDSNIEFTSRLSFSDALPIIPKVEREFL